MKKLLLVSVMLWGLVLGLSAEDVAAENGAVVSQDKVMGGEVVYYDEGGNEIELYPSRYSRYSLNLDNQNKFLKKLLNDEKEGPAGMVRYFLSLKKYYPEKALEVLGTTGNEDLKLVILETWPINAFVELLDSLFAGIGGEAVAHWGYKAGEFQEKLHMTPNVRAQQYINFFMKYKTTDDKQVKDEEKSSLLNTVMKTIKVDNEEILRSRGLKMAQVLNKMDKNKVMELLYGRPDVRFMGAKDRIIENMEALTSYKIKDTNYVYQTLEKNQYGRDPEEWRDKYTQDLNKFTSLSRVSSESINYIIPYLTNELITLIFEKEVKENTSTINDFIESVTCKKIFKDIFDYLEDSMNKVFELCEQDTLVADMLGLGGDNVLRLGSGEKGDEVKGKLKEKDEI